MATMCNPGLDQQEEEEEESEYSYEYCTDSEYEYEEEAQAEVTESIKIVVPPPPLPSPPSPPPTTVIQKSKSEDDSGVAEDVVEPEVEVNDEEFRKHREQLEKFKPKLPDYVTTAEPCAFSDDPSRWIGWMEDEVNKEKERRVRELQAAQEEEERKENEIREEEERREKEKRDEEERLLREEEERLRGEREEQERLERARRAEEERQAREMREAEEELEKAAAAEEERLRQLREKESPPVVSSSSCRGEETEGGDEEESEWEYETESEAEEGDKNTDLAEKAHSSENLIDSCGNEFAKSSGEVGESEEANVDAAVKKEGNVDCDVNKGNNEEDVVVESAEQNEVVAKATTHGQKSAGRENPDNPKLDGSLDPETQRKLDFVRRKKAEARGQTEGNEGLQQQQKQRDDPMDCLDEATRSKLEFIRQKKASAPACQSNGTDAADGAGRPNGILRQQSCPEKRARPSSIVSGGSESLDDMLARIKTLRAERKQILQDMSAIKNAFDGPSVKEEAGDDGIDSAGDSTPILENGAPFQGQQGPSAASLSRQGRRSIDSGIGSKSMSSNADGSPTAELESIHEGSESQGGGKKKIAREERETVGQEDSYFCFICGENLGRLSKGAVLHMGLDDGEPVCPDALYLTDESKEKIKNIASTKMFSHEAKYKLLETVDLEIYDIDYGIPAEDVMDKVDAFLIDVEKQKQLDREKFDAMRSGAIDEILMEEFKDILDPSCTSPEDMETDDVVVSPRPKFQFSEATQALLDGKKPPAPPPRSSSNQTMSTSSPPSTPSQSTPTSSAPPPPPPPPPSTSEETSSNRPATIPPPPPALSGVLNSIKSGQIPVLKHAETHDSSELGVGTVIHKHIAPRAFTKDMRCLVKDIRGDEHKKRLKKVKTVDKSRPFIPEDMEIYFYGGNNSDKKAPPPPLSKQPVNSSKKRGAVSAEGW